MHSSIIRILYKIFVDLSITSPNDINNYIKIQGGVDGEKSFVKQFHFKNCWFLLLIFVHFIPLLFCGTCCIGLYKK